MASVRVSVIALSGCPAAGLAWRRPSGAWTLTVVCRATLVLRPGLAALASVQHLPIAGDRAYPDGSSRGLYAPSDLVPVKPRADVIVVGRPRSPYPAGPRAARLAVGEIDKRLEPQASLAGADLGPVAATSPARAALLGAASARRPDDWIGRVVPEELDPAYFNVAPPDQQLSALRGDERLVLENLHPEHAELVTLLPGLRPLALAEGPGMPAKRIAMRADTLWIEASLGIAAIVWRGQVALDRGPVLRVIVDVEAPQAASQVAPQAAPQMAPPVAVHGPLAEDGRPHAVPVPPRGPLRETMWISPPPADDHRGKLPTLPFLPGVSAPARPASVGGGLPFQQAQSAEVSPWARGRIVAPREELPPVEEAAPPERLPPAPRPPAETLELVWFDAVSAQRVRREPRFRPILDAASQQAPDPDLDPPADEGDLADREDRRDLFEILARAEAAGEDGAAAALAALAAGVGDGGRLVQPVVMLAGELAFDFDEIEALKAVISAAPRVAGADPKTASLIALAHTLLGAPGVAYAPVAAAALAERIRAAALATVPDKQRQVTTGDLDAEKRRGLLDARAFQRRRVLGAPHVLASFRSSATPEAAPLVTYLPESLARALPRADRLRVRVLAVVHAAVDRGTAAAALRPVALAIVTSPVQM